MALHFKEFVRKPFEIRAVEITTGNIREVATYIGKVAKQDGNLFILVDPDLVPNMARVYPGYFMTMMGDHIRCYSPRVFHQQFAELTPQVEDFVAFLKGDADG